VEKLTISGRQHLCLVGEDPETTVLTFGDSAADGIGTSDSASTILSADDFSAANFTFENSSALGEGQAVALRADGQREQFYNCRFVSYQDTLYDRNGTQYFRASYVQGNTDYIFGAGTAVFDDCTIHSISEGTAVTAPRTEAAVPYGIVFRGGVFTADASVRSGHVHLARPWGPYAAAAFLEVELGAHIAAAGYTTMSENTLELTRFAEYASTGPGANPAARAPESRQLTAAEAAAYTLPTILSGWTPSYSEGL
jgi:pectinesterase